MCVDECGAGLINWAKRSALIFFRLFVFDETTNKFSSNICCQSTANGESRGEFML